MEIIEISSFIAFVIFCLTSYFKKKPLFAENIFENEYSKKSDLEVKKREEIKNKLKNSISKGNLVIKTTNLKQINNENFIEKEYTLKVVDLFDKITSCYNEESILKINSYKKRSVSYCLLLAIYTIISYLIIFTLKDTHFHHWIIAVLLLIGVSAFIMIIYNMKSLITESEEHFKDKSGNCSHVMYTIKDL
jgi:hypothetical protein